MEWTLITKNMPTNDDLTGNDELLVSDGEFCMAAYIYEGKFYAVRNFQIEPLENIIKYMIVKP